eukprot:FR737980.1.p2 GENE.FR737980.1~~FR737980.1.p2  ORF type:complete len:107 (-),score=49.79 FR737980.1:926-1246(-)
MDYAQKYTEEKKRQKARRAHAEVGKRAKHQPKKTHAIRAPPHRTRIVMTSPQPPPLARAPATVAPEKRQNPPPPGLSPPRGAPFFFFFFFFFFFGPSRFLRRLKAK